MNQIEIDDNFQQLIDFVTETNQNIFLTGKAGTGKTTALRHLKATVAKQMALVAPTGVAAINAGGTTIHSFFQLPFNPYLPDNPKKLLETLKLNSTRLKVLRELELLIIDEVSMVRADLLDAIDVVLKSIRRRKNEPFGGVQVLLIGDMYQLPPVVRDEEWSFLSQFYPSPYFFDSQVIRQNPLIYLELTKVYRQSDEIFINLLNQVRSNTIDENSIETLNTRFLSQTPSEKVNKTITLTTHNYKADQINSKALNELETKSYQFKATIRGIFSEKSYPAEAELSLKVGAQVMFIKNDPEKRFFNGKIGAVTNLSNDSIKVQCPGESFEIEVKKENWDNITYKLDTSSKQINEERLGSFEQYPLRLAWAITIHKSQGLTFDDVIIDAQEAFSAGQVYVALSRCRSLEGIILKTKINPKSLNNDDKIVHFSEAKPDTDQLKETFKQSKNQYVTQLLTQLFDFSTLVIAARNLETDAISYLKQLNNGAIEEIKAWVNELGTIQQTAQKFGQQVNQLITNGEGIEQNEALAERLQKAQAYFKPILILLAEKIEKNNLSTEHKGAGEEVGSQIQELWLDVLTKIQLMDVCKNGFDLVKYTQKRLQLKLPTKTLSIYNNTSQTVSLSVNHPILMSQLLKIRDEIIKETNLPVYHVASKETLITMANYLPQTTNDLLKIKGFGPIRVERFGDQFLATIATYCQSKGLTSLIEGLTEEKKDKSPKKEKIDTKKVSLEMYYEHQSIAKVAELRNLTQGTIFGHLSHFVIENILQLERLIPNEKQDFIKSIFTTMDKNLSYQEIKEKLPPQVSYNEVKLLQELGSLN
jgi:energy-coupling factor transporter ATP-binding protein EcfA2